MIKGVSYNIRYGLGKDGRYDLERIINEIGDADLIALQEVECFWDRSGNVDQVEQLAAAFPEHYFVYGANIDLDKSYYDANLGLVRRRRQFGNMVLSRLPIVSSRNFPLPKRALIHQHSVQKGLLETVIQAPFGAFRFYCTHLDHLGDAVQKPQIEHILQIIKNTPYEGGPWCGTHPDPETGWLEGNVPVMPTTAMLVGDMNLTHLNDGYALFLGEMTKGYGRLTHSLGFQDAWVIAGNAEEEGKSREDGRIDHCFVTADIAERLSALTIDTHCEGSDHWPLRFIIT